MDRIRVYIIVFEHTVVTSFCIPQQITKIFLSVLCIRIQIIQAFIESPRQKLIILTSRLHFLSTTRKCNL